MQFVINRHSTLWSFGQEIKVEMDPIGMQFGASVILPFRRSFNNVQTREDCADPWCTSALILKLSDLPYLLVSSQHPATISCLNERCLPTFSCFAVHCISLSLTRNRMPSPIQDDCKQVLMRLPVLLEWRLGFLTFWGWLAWSTPLIRSHNAKSNYLNSNPVVKLPQNFNWKTSILDSSFSLALTSTISKN